MCFRAFALLCLGSLCGCSGSYTAPPASTPSPAAGVAIRGSVHAGLHPIAGAHVYLFAANTTGYGNASVSLLNATFTGLSDAIGAYVTTDTTGSFSITGDYACASNTQTYLYTRGGDAGAGVNSASGLLALLGNCPNPNTPATAPTVSVNEVSTIAAAYSIAGFATDATHVSSSGTPLAQTGIANAFLNAANLASLNSGRSLTTTPAGNGVVSQAKINTLANILAACVSSPGSASTPCSTLFSNTLSGGSTGAPPTDTATAALNIVHNPGSNVANLYSLASSASPFTPALSAQPNDFTVTLQFTYPGITSNDPLVIAIDGSGNLWIPNVPTNSITELSSNGTVLSPNPGYAIGQLNNPAAVVIDTVGNAWVANINTSNVTKLSSNGTVISPASGFNGGGLNRPLAIAIDGSGDAWLANNSGPSVTKLSNTGMPISPASGYTGGGLSHPIAIAVDGAGNSWIANISSDTISKFSNTGTAISPASGYSGGGLADPQAIAIDGFGNAWVANYNAANAITKLSSDGAPVSSSGYTGGGLNVPAAIAIDGSGNAWVANASNSISKFSNSGAAISPPSGYSAGTFFLNAIAVDGSGDVWLSTDSNVVEFIGAATPVVTPISAGVKNNTLGTRP